jgi:hypothetical protein
MLEAGSSSMSLGNVSPWKLRGGVISRAGIPQKDFVRMERDVHSLMVMITLREVKMWLWVREPSPLPTLMALR